MDANKLKQLKNVKYSINGCCALCFYGKFEKGKTWGTCTKHNYSHLKHTDAKREMSICIFGKCKAYEEGKERINELGSFNKFI